MLTLNALHARRTVLFPDAFLRLDTGNIVTVGGKNLDSTTPGDTNAVGKSLLFSMIANVLYERTTMYASAKDKKSVYTEEGGSTSLWVSDGDDQHRLEQYSDGRYSIFTNGVSATAAAGKRGKDVLKIAAARGLIASLFPLSEGYFHQGLFLSSSNTSPLIHAKASDRRAFMSSLFDLDIDDLLLKEVKAHRKEISRVLAQQVAYETTIASMRKQLSEIGTPNPKRLDELERELEELRAEREAFPSQREYDRAVTELQRLQEADSSLTKDFDATSARAELEDLQATIADLRVKVSLAEQEGAARQQRDRTARRLGLNPDADLLAQVEAKLLELGKADHALTELEVYCDGNFACGYDQLGTYAEAANAVYKQRNIFPKLPLEKLQIKALETALAGVTACMDELRDELAEERHARKQAIGLEGKTSCPTCGQSCANLHHDIDAIEDTIAEIEADLNKQKTLHDKLVQAITAGREALMHLIFLGQHSMTELYELDLAELPGLADEAAGLHAQWLDMTAADTQRLRSELEDFAQLVAATPATADLAEARDELARSQRREGTLRQQLQDYDRAEKNSGKLAKARAIVDEWDANADLISEIDRDLEDATAEHAALVHAESAFSALADTLAATQRQSDECAELTRDAKVYEQLEHAYSTRGRRLAKITALARLMTDTLNHESHLLFHESMDFSLNIDETSYGIMVERNNSRPTDVAMLSKSECRRFEALHAYCLWKLMPSNLRPSLMVLDEMEDGSSDVNKELYSKVFLPTLHECIPNIFVVSPLSAMTEQSGALNLTVVKEGGFSRLEGDEALFSTDGLFL